MEALECSKGESSAVVVGMDVGVGHDIGIRSLWNGMELVGTYPDDGAVIVFDEQSEPSSRENTR